MRMRQIGSMFIIIVSQIHPRTSLHSTCACTLSCTNYMSTIFARGATQRSRLRISACSECLGLYNNQWRRHSTEMLTGTHGALGTDMIE